MSRFEIKVSEREQDWADASSPLQSVPGRAPLQSTPPSLTSPLQCSPAAVPPLQCDDTPRTQASPLQCDPAQLTALQSTTPDSPAVGGAPLQCLDV